MTVRVLFFASLKNVVGANELPFELAEGCTAEQLFDQLVERWPDLKPYRTALRVAAGEELVAWSHVLRPGEEVALLPPVSGGAPDLVRLGQEPISVDECLTSVRRDDCGAVVLFLGTVRNQTHGQPVDRLDYEAYPALARKEMDRLVVEARTRWELGGLAVWHRHGSLAPGEISVCVAVSSGHRKAAFEAGRWLIDTLKSTVPLWKKEVGPGGEVWIEGDARST